MNPNQIAEDDVRSHSAIQSQRDYSSQPRVARHELPWEADRDCPYPERSPCSRNTVCAPEPSRWSGLLPLLPGRRGLGRGGPFPPTIPRFTGRTPRCLNALYAREPSKLSGLLPLLPGRRGLGRGGRLPLRFMGRVSTHRATRVATRSRIFPVSARFRWRDSLCIRCE